MAIYKALRFQGYMSNCNNASKNKVCEKYCATLTFTTKIKHFLKYFDYPQKQLQLKLLLEMI